MNQGVKSPELSVIIPTYNRVVLLQEALASFVGLLECSYEVIIIDDGSTDGTRDFLQSLGEPYRVLLYEHRGGSAARNSGLRVAQGKFIKFLDDDDLLEPDVVNAQVSYLKTNPDIDVLYSEFSEWQSDKESREEIPAKRGQIDNLLDALLAHWWCGIFSYLFRAEHLANTFWDESLPTLQDADFILRIALTEPKVAYLPLTIGRYRRHSQSTISHMDPLVRKCIWIQIWQKTLAELKAKNMLSDKRRLLLAERFYELAEQLLPFDRSLARENLARAMELDPAYVPRRPRYRQMVRFLGHWGSMQIKHVILHKLLGWDV